MQEEKKDKQQTKKYLTHRQPSLGLSIDFSWELRIYSSVDMAFHLSIALLRIRCPILYKILFQIQNRFWFDFSFFILNCKFSFFR